VAAEPAVDLPLPLPSLTMGGQVEPLGYRPWFWASSQRWDLHPGLNLNVGASTFKADLLFFHRGLQALVAVELKKTKFHPRDLGQLEFYLEALDRDVKRSNENPSIGILLCPDADKMVVEYAMSRSMSPTLITEYKRILIPQERMQEQLNEYCNFFLEEQNNTND